MWSSGLRSSEDHAVLEWPGHSLWFRNRILSLLSQEEELCDLTFDVGIGAVGSAERRIIHAHSLILCSLSDKFRMFLARRNKGAIRLRKEDPTLFKLLLDFLYNGKISSSSQKHFKSPAFLNLLDRYGFKECVESAIGEFVEPDLRMPEPFDGGGSKDKEDGTGRFPCKTCKTVFKSTRMLAKHKLCKSGNKWVKSGGKPIWSCATCSEKFVSDCRAFAHDRKTQHDILSCECCQERFSNKEGMLNHTCKSEATLVMLDKQNASDKTSMEMSSLSDENLSNSNGGNNRRYSMKRSGNDCFDLGTASSLRADNLASETEFSVGTQLHPKNVKSDDTSLNAPPLPSSSPLIDESKPEDERNQKKRQQQQRPYLCSSCGRMLKGIAGYNLHQLIHSGLRPYECGKCGKAYNDRQRLEIHERSHTGERPYLCSLCGTAFTERSNLRRHMLKKHKVRARRKDGSWINVKSDVNNEERE